MEKIKHNLTRAMKLSSVNLFSKNTHRRNRLSARALNRAFYHLILNAIDYDLRKKDCTLYVCNNSGAIPYLGINSQTGGKK